MNLIKTIRNWLRAKKIKSDKEFEAGYKYTKTWLPTWDQNAKDEWFCNAYSQIFVDDYLQGVRKAICEYYQEQLKNEK
jgi:hypothetical protein